MITVWIPNISSWGDSRVSPSLIPEAWETTQGSIWKLKDRSWLHSSSGGLFLSVFHHPSLQCQLICSAALENKGHILTCYCMLKWLYLLSCYCRFRDQTPLTSSWTHVGRDNRIFWCGASFGCVSVPQHWTVTAPPLPPWSDCCHKSLGCFLQLLLSLFPNYHSSGDTVIFFCDFLKVLPQPKYTIPAEASQRWPQEGNYTPCRKSWWMPLRWLSSSSEP